MTSSSKVTAKVATMPCPHESLGACVVSMLGAGRFPRQLGSHGSVDRYYSSFLFSTMRACEHVKENFWGPYLSACVLFALSRQQAVIHTERVID